MPPREITLKDIPPAVYQHTSPNEPATRETTLIDSSETDGDDKVQVDYYIIVASFKSLIQARQKVKDLINDFGTEFILLPPAGGNYRISYGRYPTLEDAKSAIKSIRTNIASDAWIFWVKK